MAQTKVLVTGATGKQGGAVVDALVSGDYGAYDVYAMTRNADSEGAKALIERGVTVVEADMNDRASLDAAVAGMEYVFIVTTFFEDGTEMEREQGIRMVDACADADVAYVVYSSVASAATAPLDHFQSKHAVEEYLADSTLEWTVVRPVYFMQNFAWQEADLQAGRLALPLADGVSLGVVDVGDIGRTVATCFAAPAEWMGETVEIEGDDLTLEEFAAAFGDALGHHVDAVHLDVEAYRAEGGDEMADMYRWFNEDGYDVDSTATEERVGIDFRSFADYLANEWTSRATPAA